MTRPFGSVVQLLRKGLMMTPKRAVSCVEVLVALAVSVACVGCGPDVEKVKVHITPTLYKPSVLSPLIQMDLTSQELRNVLEFLGFEQFGGGFGLTNADLETAAVGLRTQGYSEIDARRSPGPIRSIVLLAPPLEKRGEGVLEARVEYWERPPLAHLRGIDISRESEPPVRYRYSGRGEKTLLIWRKEGLVPKTEVEKWVGSGGKLDHWKIETQMTRQEIRELAPARATSGP